MSDLVRFTARVAGYDVGDVVDLSAVDDPRIAAAIESGRAVPVEGLVGVSSPETPTAPEEPAPAVSEDDSGDEVEEPRKAPAPKKAPARKSPDRG